MQKIEWIDREGQQRIDFVFDDSTEAIQAMIEADATDKVGPAIARAISTSIALKDDVAFDIASQASEEMAMKMGHSEEQAQAGTQALKAKYF